MRSIWSHAVDWGSRAMVWPDGLTPWGFWGGPLVHTTPRGIVDWTKPRPRTGPIYVGVKICHFRKFRSPTERPPRLDELYRISVYWGSRVKVCPDGAPPRGFWGGPLGHTTPRGIVNWTKPRPHTRLLYFAPPDGHFPWICAAGRHSAQKRPSEPGWI